EIYIFPYIREYASERDTLSSIWGAVQLFPDGCDELMKLLEADDDNEFNVELLADHRDGIAIYSPQTADGYAHNVGIAFEIGYSTVVVLFPYVTDGRCERPITVYVDGDAMPDGELETLIGLIISTLEEMISEPAQ
ncbi:MAG: hypothetical protein Q7S47_00920, partial [bacterium]|nr:hypothetical protein [bacterium]